MGFWKSIGDAIYREYDRRIKRASLVTEYGAHHGHAAHAEPAHAAVAEAAEAEAAPAPEDEGEEAEILNVPRGTPVSEP